MGLGRFVLKTLNDKVKVKKIIESDDFFEVIGNMGLTDVDVEVVNIIEYLENENIDINFNEGQSKEYIRFKSIKNNHQLMKRIKVKKEDVKNMMIKVENITPPERPNWLEYYRSDDDNVEATTTIDDFDSINQRIRNTITSEMERIAEIRGEEVINDIRQQLNGDITGEGF
jgi:hypothetical protein